MRLLLRLCSLPILALLFSAQAWAISPVETAKIEALIAHVAALQGARFIRNGDAHPPAEAADHLRMKWEKAGKRVQTAEDFIRLCASQSYLSGKPYQIQLANGQVSDAGPYLRRQLALMTGTAAQSSKNPPGS